MAKRSGLGKGLDSLISAEAGTVEAVQRPKKSVEPVKDIPKEPEKEETMIKLRLIEPNREQPRKEFNEEKLAELAESIRQYGVIQPLLLVKNGNYYTIVAGERRYRAAKLAGLKEVPAIVKEFTEEEIAEIALVENLQREDLNPLEEAMAYQRLLKEFHMTQEEIARKVSKSRSVIANSLRLLKLEESVQHMVEDGTLSNGHAKVLLGIEDLSLQAQAAFHVASLQLSVRETEQYIKQLLHPKEKKEKPTFAYSEVYQKLAERMQERVGTKVRIIQKDQEKGKIEIEYYSGADLERLLELLG
ncbi:MAG: ParB/RepB/Spo0J family partition protein [Lachnospiraceae bacterium]|nr:ParB/RepB/Spo0J family partition protein [Lachnospiraceae bacterium]